MRAYRSDIDVTLGVILLDAPSTVAECIAFALVLPGLLVASDHAIPAWTWACRRFRKPVRSGSLPGQPTSWVAEIEPRSGRRRTRCLPHKQARGAPELESRDIVPMKFEFARHDRPDCSMMLEFAANQDQRFFDILGMAGVAAYLSSYAALQTGLLKGQTYAYAACNILAASLVLISLSRDFNLAAVAIQVSWIAISVAGIARLLFIHYRTIFTLEEDIVVQALAPDLPKHRARKLISLGQWRRAGPSEVLLQQGEPVMYLDYLIEGTCEVSRDGALIARIGRDSLVGEMGYLSGELASATVRAVETVRFFSFEANRLRAAMQRNPDLASALERSVARALRRRLSAATDEICLLRHAVASRDLQRDGTREAVDNQSGTGANPF